ncbi:MAG: HesA/MoeB/ThiF family protein [Deltaproteobacteria bacterium]|nr:MAG: HesA/MoeB/ThiF family protein [Deltaproteobacteria bacterium]
MARENVLLARCRPARLLVEQRGAARVHRPLRIPERIQSLCSELLVEAGPGGRGRWRRRRLLAARRGEQRNQGCPARHRCYPARRRRGTPDDATSALGRRALEAGAVPASRVSRRSRSHAVPRRGADRKPGALARATWSDLRSSRRGHVRDACGASDVGCGRGETRGSLDAGSVALCPHARRGVARATVRSPAPRRLPRGGRRGLARRSAGFAPALASGARRRVDRRGYRAARSPSLLRPAPRDRPDPGGSRGCRAGAGSRRPRARLAGVARRRCRGGVRPRPGRGCNRERTRRARVLARASGMKTAVLLGAGGLGCPAALALAESQPDLRLIIVDPDRVDRSNLARQILYGEADLGAHKAEVAARRTGGEARVARFDAATADELLADADVLLDGTDDFPTRFLANDEALRRGIPLVHGAALGWTGQLLTVLPGRTACLRCLFEGPPDHAPTCAEAGVLAALCGLVGAAMARAALAVLRRDPEAGVLHRWDARTGTHRPLPLERDPACAACAAAASYEARS